jgi:hypothetical protein
MLVDELSEGCNCVIQSCGTLPLGLLLLLLLLLCSDALLDMHSV